MAREGLDSLYSLDATAVMGLREVVPAIPPILRRVRQAVDFAVQTKPDVVVVIDSPDFTHRVARGIKKRDPSIRTVDYVAPQVWASRAYRAKADGALFRPGAGAVSLRGAVLREIWIEGRLCRPSGDRAGGQDHRAARRLRARLGIAADAPLLALLPGSRTSEIRFILPVFHERGDAAGRSAFPAW